MRKINIRRLYEQAKRYSNSEMQDGILANWVENRPAHLYLLLQNNQLQQALEAHEAMILNEIFRLVKGGCTPEDATEIAYYDLLLNPYYNELDRELQKRLEVEQGVKVRPLSWIADSWAEVLHPQDESMPTETTSSPTPTEPTSPKPPNAKKSTRPSKPSEP